MPLPATYASPLDLPFNRSCLGDDFQLLPPDAGVTGPPLWLVLSGLDLLVRRDENGLHLPDGDNPPAASAALLIGSWQGRPCYALAVDRESDVPSGLERQPLNAAEPELSIELLSLGALAAQLLQWDRSSRFCSRCGVESAYIAGERGRRCPACRHERYPAIHPCVIVVVRRGDELLLARKAEWPPGRYGLVAGFVDPGEALEEAVTREVLEETGIRVTNIRYIGSQAWPFPSQIMAGFVADYAGGAIAVDPHELEDARWFRYDSLPQLPPRRSIARFLIDRAVEAIDVA